jgi:predicted transposase YdaD
MTAAMPMQFDATLKNLAREHPRAFLAAFDRPPPEVVSLLNVDLSTVTTAADFVAGLGDPPEEIVHIDFQTSASATKHADILVYNALLHRHYSVPVHSILVLLRPQAAHPNLSGVVSYSARPERGKMDFSYEVVRIWEHSADDFLSGDVGTAPLAMLGQLPEGIPLADGLAAFAQRLIARLDKETPRDEQRRLLTAAFLLTGLRVPREIAFDIFRKVSAMKESDTYLAILDEGAERQAKDDILMLGEDRFGSVDEQTRTKLMAVNDLERLKRIVRQVLKASSWSDLVETR